MDSTEYDHIHSSKYHYWLWVAKFYITHPKCLWSDLWWRWMPGEIVRFHSHRDWDRSDFEQWLWDHVGIKNVSWGLRIDNWLKNEGYDYAIKVRRGKTQHISHLALIAQ